MRKVLQSLVLGFLVTAAMTFLPEAPAQEIRSDGRDSFLGICPPQGPAGEVLVSGKTGNGTSEFNEEFSYVCQYRGERHANLRLVLHWTEHPLHVRHGACDKPGFASSAQDDRLRGQVHSATHQAAVGWIQNSARAEVDKLNHMSRELLVQLETSAASCAAALVPKGPWASCVKGFSVVDERSKRKTVYELDSFERRERLKNGGAYREVDCKYRSAFATESSTKRRRSRGVTTLKMSWALKEQPALFRYYTSGRTEDCLVGGVPRYWADLSPESGSASAKIWFLESSPQFRELFWAKLKGVARPCDVSEKAAELVVANDGYWEWFSEYVAEKVRRQQRMDEIRFELSALAKEVSELRRQWMDLLRLDMELFHAEDVLEDNLAGLQIGVSTRAARDRLRVKINEATLEQRALLDEGLEQITILKKSVEAQREKSGDRRSEVLAEMGRLEDMEQVLELQYHDAAEWYAPHQLPRLIRELRFDSGSAPEVVKIVEAKAHLADARYLEEQLNTPSAVARNRKRDDPIIKGAITARFKALEKVREVLMAHPDHEEARAMQQQMELYWLNRIGLKLEQEKQVSLAAFGEYLTKRGYDINDRSGWWERFKEYVWITWSSGPISLGTSLPGVDMPWIVAEDVSIAQTEIAKNLVSLMAIKRLRRNGLSLTDVRTITPDNLAEKMVLHTVSQKPLPEEKARRMTRDIRETFAELAELQALEEGKMVKFNLAMGRSHYGAVNPDQSWGEYLGDAFSPRHLIGLFGPSAIVKINDKWARGWMAGAEIRAADATGKVFRGRDALVTGLRLEKLADRLAATRGGGWFRQKLIADHRWFTELPGWERFLRKGTAVVGMMIILGGTSHLAAESGIPGAVLLVDILGDLTGQEILFDIISKAGTPVRKLLGQVDELLVFTAKKQDDLARLGRTLGELDAIAVKARARKGNVTGEMKKRLERICRADNSRRYRRKGAPGLFDSGVELARVSGGGVMHFGGLPAGPVLLLTGSTVIAKTGCPGVGAAVATVIPGSTERGAQQATKRAIAALRRGDVAEAQRAVRAAKALREQAEGQLQKTAAKAHKARELLKRAPTSAKIAAVTEQLSKIDDTVPKSFTAPEYYRGETGKILLAGDELWRRGELDKALVRYKAARKIQRAARAESKPSTVIEERLDFLEERIALLVNTQKVIRAIRKARRSGPRVKATRVISNKELRAVLGRMKAGKYQQIEGSLNAVFRVSDGKGGSYIVKKIDDRAEAATEVAASLLAEKLGLKAPRARALAIDGIEVTYKVRGGGMETKKLRIGLVSRSVKEGTEGVALKLSKATEPVAVALKKDYARQRVFRAWLGDSDGHLGNQLFAADGRLWQVDFGMGSLKPNQAPRHFRGKIRFETEADFMRAVLGLPYGKQAMPRVKLGKFEDVMEIEHFIDGLKRADSYQWMARMDEMIHYKDMKSTIDTIFALTRGKARELKRILKQSGHPEPDKAFEVLKTRADSLESILRERFAKPIQTGSVHHHRTFESLARLQLSFDWIGAAA